MQGYKGFNSDLTCKDFQYREGEEFVHDGPVSLCESGFHFCLHPLDCLTYYYPNGKNVYHRVLAKDYQTSCCTEDTKCAAKKIFIGAEIAETDLAKDVCAYLKSCPSTRIPTIYDPAVYSMDQGISVVSSYVQTAALTSAPYTHASTEYYASHAVTCKEHSHATTEGIYASAMTCGPVSCAATSADRSPAITCGRKSHALTAGGYSYAMTCGDKACAVTRGDGSCAVTQGIHSQALTYGPEAHAVACGQQGCAESYGAGSQAVALGLDGAAQTHSQDGLAIATGRYAKARGVLGSWLVLAELDKDFKVLDVKSVRVDGDNILPGIWYTLHEGQVRQTDDEIF